MAYLYVVIVVVVAATAVLLLFYRLIIFWREKNHRYWSSPPPPPSPSIICEQCFPRNIPTTTTAKKRISTNRETNANSLDYYFFSLQFVCLGSFRKNQKTRIKDAYALHTIHSDCAVVVSESFIFCSIAMYACIAYAISKWTMILFHKKNDIEIRSLSTAHGGTCWL